MTKSRISQPAGRPSGNLSPTHIRAAIRQFESRIKELEDLPVESIAVRSEPRVVALVSAIDGTLARVFGADTSDYHRLREAKSLDTTTYHATVQLGGAFRGGGSVSGTPIHEIRSGVDRGRKRAIALLGREVELLKEQLGDEGGAPDDRAIRAYRNLDLHPKIARAASDLYRNGHYANAIEDSEGA